MSSDVTRDVVLSLVATGLEKGSVQTDFGIALVRGALLNGASVLTITFPDVEEKWVVTENGVVGVRYVVPSVIPPEVTVPKPIKVKVEGEEHRKITLVQQAQEKADAMTTTFKPKKEKAMKESKTPVVIEKTIPPKTERPRTKLAKVKKETGTVPEQPPTKRARIGRPVDPKAKAVTVKKSPGSGKVTGLKLTGKKPHGKQPKVLKVGPKEPVWRRQLGWKGDPEKIDINLFPVKIVCTVCGQPRYVDARNAAIKDHPVTLCRPCQYKHKQREHDRKVREKKQAAKDAALKAEKKATRIAKAAKK